MGGRGDHREAPDWFGLRYPSQEDLEAYACDLGASVVSGPVPKGAYFPARVLNDGMCAPPVIVVPDSSPLARAWSLAHELGHLVLHSGPKGELYWRRDEAKANRWASCALIPEARIALHSNASTDAFIGALSAHFEELPLIDCASRRLAGKIARHRIHALSVSQKES